MSSPPTYEVKWQSWRIIPSRNPPVDLYRRVAAASDWPSIINVELKTNPRVRETREGLGLVRPEDMKGGATQNWILAPFTYLNPEGTRHSDGTFGTSFLTKELQTALLESIRLRETFLSRTEESPIQIDMRVIKTTLAGEFDDASKAGPFSDSKKAKQYWKDRRTEGCDGVYFKVPEFFGGECVEAFRPRFMQTAVQERHLTYWWDGREISKIYDFREGKDIDLEALRKTGQLKYFVRNPAGAELRQLVRD